MGRLTKAAATAAMVALALTACGGGGGGSSRESQTEDGKAYVDAMMSTYSADMGFTEPQARCIAELAIDTVGVQALEDAGITPDKMNSSEGLLADYTPTTEQADQLVDGVFGCVDFGELMVSQMAADDTVSLPEDKVRCIGNEMAKSEAFKDSLKADMLGLGSIEDAAIDEAIFGIFDTCKVDFADLMGG
jgi:hypothetical protein